MKYCRRVVATLMLIFCFVQAFAQELSVDYNAVRLKAALSDIHDKTGVNFVYNNSLVDVDVLVTVSASGTLSQVLDAVLAKLPVDYEILDGQVILKSRKTTAAVRTVTVSGVVTDDSGIPLPGVFVSQKGTSNASASDMDGKYVLEVPVNATLVFSSLGFNDYEAAVPAKGGKLDVRMETGSTMLEEVVFVGYGVQKKVNLTGSVASINVSEGLESRPITTTSAALSGLAAGVVVTQTSGRPGEDGASIRIRGNTTLNTNSPLVLVDGIEYSMDNVNPQDIESISVLKDAASTAIYGSRAANGVIIITTKSGKAGKMQISYSGNVSAQTPSLRGMSYVTDYPRHMRLVNEGADNVGVSHPYSDLTIELWENAKKSPDALNAYGVKNSIAYPNTDWFGELFQTGLLQSHNVSLSGGNDLVKAYVSIGYLNNPGVMSHHGLDSGTRKIDVRANVEMNITKWLTGGIRLSGERQGYGMSDVSAGFSYLKAAIPGMYPGSPNKWGVIATNEESQNANNIFRNMAAKDGKSYNYRASATAFLKARLYDGLFAELTMNHNVNLGYENKYDAQADRWDYVSNTLYQSTSLTTASNKISISNSYRSNIEALVRYNNTFGKHDIGALAGYSMIYHKSPWNNSTKQGKTDWEITEHSAYINLISADSGFSEWGLMSFFSRLNYAYDSRYLVEANLRVDGSSRFAPQSRWGIFPSFSGGWRISEERWMKDSRRWLDNLKIRASWGMTGNNNSGNYAWQSTFTSVDVVSGGTESSGLITTALGNNQLVWETTKTSDIGIDAGFFGNRLTVEADGYIRNTSGILFRPSIFLTMGSVTAPYTNLAGVRNNGAEFTVKWRDGVGRDFSYSIGLNMAYNKTTVTKYKGKLVQGWVTDEEGNKVYKNNIGDVGQSGFGGYIVEDHVLGDQYILSLYRGNGVGYSGTGDVDPAAGPKDGMIRTQADMDWVTAMMKAGYKFQGGQSVGKNILYYGDFIYADTNGDDNYGDTNDYHFTGHSSTPKLTAGLNLGFKYKGLDFYALFTGAFGFYINWNTSVYNTTLVNLGQAITNRIASDHYSAATPDATYPRLTYNKTLNAENSDFYHYKGDYVKMKSLQIGYTFKDSWMERIKVKNLRIYFTAENLFTLTTYPGLDPEIGGSITYPLMRTFCGGIQLSL